MVSPKKVLIVDADPKSEIKLKPLFLSHNYQTLFVDNAKEGLQIAEDWQPQIIVLDLVLPQMSGLGFLREIKYNFKTKHIPILILSEITDFEVIYEALELGAVGFLNKFEKNSELLSLIKDCTITKSKTLSKSIEV